MSYEFKLPDLGEGLTEGEIARWLVAEGQEIAEDDPLVEIATDKTTVEIPSPAAGTVSKILVGEGEVVPVGTVLVVIGGGGEDRYLVRLRRTRYLPVLRHLFDVLPKSSASTSTRSPVPGRRGGSRSRTCAAPPVRRKDAASRSAASGGRCSST